jgi:formylglycine-generating enzyme required for sulfatase activity
MVYVPAGTFTMGSRFNYKEPAHEVYLDAFWIDQTEVTNARYRLCVDEGVCLWPSHSDSEIREKYYDNPEFDDYPVAGVTWFEAQTHCEWANKRLPTEAEWEKAARGTDERLYPWGDDIDCSRLNCCQCVGDATRVGSHPSGASPYGCLDMAGNVHEWVADWLDRDYYGRSPRENPQGPDSGTYRVVRGGSWWQVDFFALTVHRDGARPGQQGQGFRCASSSGF